MRNNSDHSGVDRWVQEGLGVTRCIHIAGQNLKRAQAQVKSLCGRTKKLGSTFQKLINDTCRLFDSEE